MIEPILNRERFPRELEILRQLADGLPQIVWVAKPDGSHEYYNLRWYEFTGRPHGSLRTGWSDLFHPDDTLRADKAWAEALSSGKPYEIEFRLKRASDGAYRWFLGRALPLLNDDGEVVNWFGTCTDIHALKAAHEALRTARDELRQESLQKDEFLGVVSHELRTPLNAVFGWTRLMQENLLNEEERIEAVNSIMRNAEAQGRLIEDVLDMTRIANHRLSLERKILNVERIATEAVVAIAPSANAKAVKLKTVIETHDLWVFADAMRLQQVLLNLLTNAVKFTPPGGAVCLRVAEADDGGALIEVSDTGEGIGPELLPHIFERFRQGDSSSTHRHGGLGLGLTIAHELVTLHGGTIAAKSEGEGKGSSFILNFPLADRDSFLAKRAERPVVREIGLSEKALKGLRVMVVDDDAGVRDVVTMTLTKCGAKVVAVASAKEALKRLSDFSPHVVLSDIAMPDLDGYEFVQRLRRAANSRNATIPVIALTAYGSSQDRERALKAGFDQHVTKPIDPTQLVQAVATSRTEETQVSSSRSS